ncbi:MAG TPA: hypothetical protein VEA69_16745 [Tepidisphaeraceae bacterium]|nr:hypothetical protein [Tepidisphaeraceae bacterium]
MHAKAPRSKVSPMKATTAPLVMKMLPSAYYSLPDGWRGTPGVYRGPGGQVIQLMLILITPEMAGVLLNGKDGKKQSKNFRNVRQSMLRQYAEVMGLGLWELNGDTIVIDPAGYVRNGQHRLLACIESGVPLFTVVVLGIDPKTETTHDNGGRRTLAQYLAKAGEAKSGTLASALVWLWRFENDKAYTRPTVPISVSMNLFRKRNGLRDSVAATSEAGKVMLPGLAAALHYLIATQFSREKANRFFDLVGSGAELAKGDPILAFRAYMLRRDKPSPERRAAIAIKTWNKWSAGESVVSSRAIDWNNIGPDAQPFPTLAAPAEKEGA